MFWYLRLVLPSRWWAVIGVFSGFVWFLGIVLIVFEFGLVIAIVLCCFCLRCLLVSCGFLSGELLL